MKIKNMAFQVRDAYWRSKARLLINWLLKRLGIIVGEAVEAAKDGVNLVAWLTPFSIFVFFLVCLFRWVWG